MPGAESVVTVHMAASLDGFIARRDGRVEMGSRTYERALEFEAQGSGWAYGDTPIVVLTHRSLPA